MTTRTADHAPVTAAVPRGLEPDHTRGDAHDHDVDPRRHRQDRPPGRAAPDRARPADPDRHPSTQPSFDWNDQATWAPALQGMGSVYVGSVYVAYAPDLAFPGAAETVGAFADLAVASGARRLVLLSGRGEEGAQRGEQAVRDAGADWTLVQEADRDA